MFERYSEKARRVIFFARYEASQFGSPVIGAEHLLLGLVRGEKLLCSRWLPQAQPATIRNKVGSWTLLGKVIPTHLDLPPSEASKHVLFHAKDGADRLKSKHIGTEHLLLGLILEKEPTSDLRQEPGGDLGKLRRGSGVKSSERTPTFSIAPIRHRKGCLLPRCKFTACGATERTLAMLSNAATNTTGTGRKALWQPLAIVVNRKTCKRSFELNTG
jgi:ATP-dependent Clp protease ATP-binding subunit ClpA